MNSKWAPEDKVGAAARPHAVPGSIQHLAALREIAEIVASGYAGVTSSGTIVDRREHPTAIPIPKNSLFGTPASKHASGKD